MRIRLLLSLLLLLFTREALADLVVVVNVRNSIQVMTRQEVINLFFGRINQFANGVEAQPVDLIDKNPDRARFYRQLVGKDVADINAYWARMSFSGRQNAPARVADAEEVIRWVSSRPGGIGFIDGARVDGRLRVVYELK